MHEITSQNLWKVDNPWILDPKKLNSSTVSISSQWIGVTFEIRVLIFVDIQFPEILWIGCEIQSSSERDPAVNWEWWGWCLYTCKDCFMTY